MRNIKILKIAGLLLVIIAGIVATKLASAQNQRQPENEQLRDARIEDRKQIVQAIRDEGLRGAAKLKGNFVMEYDPYHHQPPFGLEGLTINSAAAIIGTPTGDIRSRLSKDGSFIYTDYEILVQETLKGDIQSGSTIKVALPGGKVKFTDGTSAEIKLIEFSRMRRNTVYTLYLSKDENGAYTLAAGPYGLIETLIGKKVRSYARPNDVIAKEVKDKDVATFLKEARKLAKKYPVPGQCCSSF